ncbi:DUF4247 domain-containing protein [Sutcliffiella deserti]|uniref:DUF4247 domain-containing protein n=1 Tax=Sutcliffiella deserti TaxID=2875501 RepID=UPI001CBC8B75|nr:DUF4247 domain-containing protein [Sutcliffiella deserti]
MRKPLLSLLLTFTLLLSACSSGNGGLFKDDIVDFISNEYRIYDTVSSVRDSANFSEIYIAENRDMDDVTSNITSHEQPEEMSERKDGKQVLVYDNLFVIITEDEENPSNTFIEVANDKFVRNNYSPDFFDGLFLYMVLNNLLRTNDWGDTQKLRCQQNPENCYGGYGKSGGSFKGSNQTPTIRSGSSPVRGGGPGAGK